MTNPLYLEHGGDLELGDDGSPRFGLRQSEEHEAWIARLTRFSLTAITLKADVSDPLMKYPAVGPLYCSFVQDRRDCFNPAMDGHIWCRFHREANAHYRTNWGAMTYEQRCNIGDGFSVKWYERCYFWTLQSHGPERVAELMDAWNQFYKESKRDG